MHKSVVLDVYAMLGCLNCPLRSQSFLILASVCQEREREGRERAERGRRARGEGERGQSERTESERTESEED